MFKQFFKWLFKTTGNAIVTIFIFFIILTVVIAALTSKAPFKVKPNTYLVLSFATPLSETAEPKLDISTDFTKTTLSHLKSLMAIQAATNNPNIKGIILKLDSWNVNRAQNDEIKEAIELFKKSDKKVYAYGTMLSQKNYNIAIVADEIIMPPSASCMTFISGYSRTMPYYKDLSDKIGIKATVIHMGNYKAYGENYVKNKMSHELRTELVKIYDKIYNNFLSDVSKERNIPYNQIESLINSGKLIEATPQFLKEKGLLDNLLYYEDFIDELKQKNGIEKLETLSIDKYAQNLQYTSKKKKIAILIAEGEIKSGSASSPIDEYKNIYPQSIIDQIKKIKNDKSIVACVLRVNSPGGSALSSDLILREIEKLKEKMPIVVSMGGVAASGGYYISSKANKIFVDKSTITGSIGVVAIIPNVNELTKKIGINFESISKGKNADLLNFAKETSKEELDVIKSSMQKVYTEFKTHVSEGRNIEINKLEEYAQGKIWTGEQAIKIGLADELGGINAAISEAAKIAKTTNYGIAVYPKEKTLLQLFTENELGSQAKSVLIASLKSDLAGKTFRANKMSQKIITEINNYLDLIETSSKQPLLYLPLNLSE